MDAGWRELSQEQLRKLFIAVPAPPNAYHFFTFERGTATPDSWDIIGVWEQRHDPLLLDVFLIQVSQSRVERLSTLYASTWSPEETTSDPPVNLAIEEPGTIGFTPAEYLRLVRFFERWIGPVPTEADDVDAHFKRIDPKEPTWPPDPDQLFTAEPCYKYYADADVSGAGTQVAVLTLPKWRTEGTSGPRGYLGFLVFERDQYDDPDFDPYIEYGLGHIAFNASGLRDFVVLLRRNNYRSALTDTQA